MTAADRLPALDGLRAYAALCVIATHVYYLSDVEWGVTSVWVFFILSGFLLFRSFVQREFRAGWRDITIYLVRRVFRILPLYYLALIVHRVLAVPPYQDGPFWLTHHLLFTEAAGHFWTIKQEMICYLVLPLIVVPCVWLRRWWAALILLLVLIPLSYVLFNVLSLVVLRGGLGGMQVHITAFLCGMALAVVADRIDPRWGRLILCVGAAGTLAVNWHQPVTFHAFERLSGLPPDGTPFSHPYLVWPFVLVLVLGVYLHPVWLLSNPIARWIGTISFSVYCWHFLVLNQLIVRGGLRGQWTVFLAGAAGSIALGALTYRWVELPGIACGQWLATRVPRGRRIRARRYRDDRSFAGTPPEPRSVLAALPEP